jgi:hypothetical protein
MPLYWNNYTQRMDILISRMLAVISSLPFHSLVNGIINHPYRLHTSEISHLSREGIRNSQLTQNDDPADLASYTGCCSLINMHTTSTRYGVVSTSDWDDKRAAALFNKQSENRCSELVQAD